MAVSYTLKETFTGKRTETVAVPDNGEGATKEIEVAVTDIKVEFKSDSPDVTHTRQVNVCFDSSGNYDDTATKVRCEEVAKGVENKIAVGIIS